jgi:hypothetical protein
VGEGTQLLPSPDNAWLHDQWRQDFNPAIKVYKTSILVFKDRDR